jgi:metallo-beta-lactamase class B
MKKHISLLGAVAIWALSSAAPANTSADEQAKAAIQKHISAAARLAGKEWDGLYRQRCQVDSAPLTQQQRSAAPRVERPAPPPMQVFDNLYYLGIDRVSAWALKTSDGIIIIDSLYTPEQAEEYIIGGLKKLGLKPADVRYIVVSHGHGDHFGGAQYLKGVTGARIVASAAEWDYMDSVPRARWA